MSPDCRTSSCGKSACTAVGDVLEGVDVVLVAGQLHGDEVRRPVRAGLRLGDLVDRLERGHAGHDLGRGLLGLGLVEVTGRARDEHLLDVRLVEVAGLDHRVGATGLTQAAVGVGRLLGRDHARPGRRRGPRTRPSRGSRATGGGRTSGRPGGPGMRAGSSWIQARAATASAVRGARSRAVVVLAPLSGAGVSARMGA